MKRLLILLVLFVSTCLSGCGVVDSQLERRRRYRSITALQARMIVDDIDYVLLLDRPSYLTTWYVRGNE